MISSYRSDNQLATAYLQTKEESILQALFQRHVHKIYAFVYKIVQDADQAEDITQETFVKIWRRLDQFDVNQSFSNWAFAIARNQCLDWLRKKRTVPLSVFENKEGQNVLMNTLVDTAMNQAEQYDRSILTEFVSGMMRTLTEKAQKILHLHYNDGLSLAEVAAKLGYPVNSVKSWHHRALKDLRVVVAEHSMER